MWEKAMRGRTSVHVVNDRDRHIAVTRKGGLDIQDIQAMHFFSRSEIRFSDSSSLQLPAPTNPSSEIGLANVINYAASNNGLIPKGMVICEGTIDSGDLVLVDKFAYHINSTGYGYGSANEGSHNGKKLPQYLAKEGDTLSLAATAPRHEGIRGARREHRQLAGLALLGAGESIQPRRSRAIFTLADHHRALGLYPLMPCRSPRTSPARRSRIWPSP